MSTYSKLIAGVAGNVIGILFTYFAFKGWAVVGPDGVATMFGFSQPQIMGAVMLAINAIFIERAPANK